MDNPQPPPSSLQDVPGGGRERAQEAESAPLGRTKGIRAAEGEGRPAAGCGARAGKWGRGEGGAEIAGVIDRLERLN